MMSLKKKYIQTEPLPRSPGKGAVVRPLCFSGDDQALAAALKADEPGAMEAFYRRYAKYVQRILARIVNVDMDLAELMQEIFVEAFSSIHCFRDESSLQTWLTSITVFTARKHLRKRFKWLSMYRSYPVIEWPVSDSDFEDREALRYTYAVLERMPVDERVAFSLRYIEEMGLAETADACGVSLATIKRRLARAKRRFAVLAQNCPILKEWIQKGDRWR